MSALYGVSPRESEASGLAEYSASSGIESLAFQGIVSLPVGELALDQCGEAGRAYERGGWQFAHHAAHAVFCSHRPDPVVLVYRSCYFSYWGRPPRNLSARDSIVCPICLDQKNGGDCSPPFWYNQ